MLARIKGNPSLAIRLFLVATTAFYLIFGFLRSAVADETIYLREALLMSKLISSGTWFGDYAVGLHGFLFKIPAALLFLVTGPSVYAATLTTLFFSIGSLYLYYRILYKHFNFRGWAVLGTFLLATNYRFFTSTISYLREIPVLFAVLLFLDAVLSRRNKWVTGLILLLMFDAKEYVYFMILPAYLIWLVLDGLVVKKSVKNILLVALAGIAPFLVFSFLMFYTSVIPINMFNASILGFIDRGLEWNTGNFSITNSTTNLDGGSEKTIALITIPVDGTRLAFEVKNDQNGVVLSANTSAEVPQNNPVLRQSVGGLNIGLSYLGKILYPRTLSFLSIPKVMFFPSLITAIYYFKKWKNKQDSKYLILPIVFFIYTAIFLLRASHGRYLFPISPIIILFFLYFLKYRIRDTSFAVKTLGISFLFSLGGAFFETTYVLEKMVLSLFLYTCLVTLVYMQYKHSRLLPSAQRFTAIIFGMATLFVALLFSFKQGQISQYLKWGLNMECDRIAQVSGEGNAWMNDVGCGELLMFFRQDLNANPEWYWKLADWVPKKHMLKTLGEPKTFSFYWGSENRLRKLTAGNSVQRLILTESTLPGSSFPLQHKLDSLKNFSWLSYKGSLILQNKIVYVFDVKL